MKNLEFVKAYVNGKKSAILNEGGEYWLMSYTKDWADFWRDAIPFKNKRGYFAAKRICSSVNCEFSQAVDIIGDLCGRPIYLEGSGEYAAKRAEVENNGRRAKRGKNTPKPEPVAIADPVLLAPKTKTVEPMKAAVNKVRHAKFAMICDCIEAGEAVYLYGPAGTGKSYMAREIAEELGLDFYPQSAINDKFELEGGQDPRNGSNGFIETAFYKAFKYGGLFLLDEADASDNTQLIALNNAIADRRYSFPVVGLVEAHPNFRFIATGNTAGRGADASYNTRQAQDASFLNRFALRVKIDYDLGIEIDCAKGDSQLVDFGHELRAALSEIRCSDAVFTYRNLSMIKKLTTKNDFGKIICTVREALEGNFFCALKVDTIKAIASRINKGGKYRAALIEIAEAV